MARIRWLSEVGTDEVAEVGAENARLGELIRVLTPGGVRVPDGFAVTGSSYREFLVYNGLVEPLRAHLEDLQSGFRALADVGASIRALLAAGEVPPAVERAVRVAYRELSERSPAGEGAIEVAVSVRGAPIGDHPADPRCAGHVETFVDVRGADRILEICRSCFVWLYDDRAIADRETGGLDRLDATPSIRVQKMVRSGVGGSGVCLMPGPEAGLPPVVSIVAAWGPDDAAQRGRGDADRYTVSNPLPSEPGVYPHVDRTSGSRGRKIVSGSAPEERRVFFLTDPEAIELAGAVVRIERLHGGPVEVQWARDGETGEILVVHAGLATAPARAGSHVSRTGQTGEPRRRQAVSTGLSIGTRGLAT